MATKFYLHRATANPPGTMPGASALGGTPTVSEANASTLRWMDGTISAVAQTSAQTTTDGTANAQTAWFTRHVSAPLAAQTISAQTLTYSLAAAESNTGSNFNPTIYVALWRPGTGAKVGDIMAVGTITATEPSTTQTATSGTGTSTQQVAQAGDVLIVETWRKSVAPGAATARTNTTFYDGTTEASTTNVATFVNFANTLTFQAIAPAPTAASLTATGATPTVTVTDDKAVAPSAASLNATGATPTVTATANQLSAPTAASLTASGATPAVTTPVATAPSAVALTAAGTAPVIGSAAIPTAAGLTTSGGTPSVLAPALQVPDAASLTISGAVPAVKLPVAAAPDAVALTTTLETPAVKTPVVTEPDAVALELATDTPDILTPVLALPDNAELAVTGATPNVQAGTTDNIEVVPDAAALEASGATPTVAATANVKVVPTWPMPLALVGATPTVAAGASWVLAPTPQALVITGARPRVTVKSAKKTIPVNWALLNQRPPHNVQLQPPAAHAALVMAAPQVTILDDGDVMRLVELIG